ANPDIRRAFQEFADEDTPSKCNKVRCLHCGYVRAKNTTRQIEHLQQCENYLNSPEAQSHLQNASDGAMDSSSLTDNTARAVLNGHAPNPNLQVHRRGPNQNKRNRDGQPIANQTPRASSGGTNAFVPSLTAHLLNSNAPSFTAATEQPFLSHAGCGTLAAGPLAQWMVQDGHYTRGYVQFIGGLISKIRLPTVPNSQFNPMYRTLDLLISALNNIRREMSFFEITATKYGIQMGEEPPNPITRAYLDLFVSCSGPSASLLEGLVVLWATEHHKCYRTAWQYASTFSTSLSHPTTEPHIAALHQALIPNWTSPAFSKFVDACRSLVDELANTTTSPNGKEEMARCEQVFRQICWIQERFWPDVDGMGEEDERGGHSHNTGLGAGNLGAGNLGDAGSFGGVLNGVAEAAAGAS
ncbi:heme oxygenase-like protein, partial [Rhizodiscina lignyota]